MRANHDQEITMARIRVQERRQQTDRRKKLARVEVSDVKTLYGRVFNRRCDEIRKYMKRLHRDWEAEARDKRGINTSE